MVIRTLVLLSLFTLKIVEVEEIIRQIRGELTTITSSVWVLYMLVKMLVITSLQGNIVRLVLGNHVGFVSELHGEELQKINNIRLF
jgi:hypothetical protein